MINKHIRKSLAGRNGNEILIWIWNNPTGKHVSDSIQEQILSIQVHKNEYYDNHCVPLPATFLKTIKNRKYILEEPDITYHTTKKGLELLVVRFWMRMKYCRSIKSTST